MVQLDNMTRGRVIFGTGPGKLPLDAHMMGIDTTVQRRRQREALEVIMPLLRGETVTAETDWFTLRDARLHLLPYRGPGEMEVAAASIASPSGSQLCGTLGLSLLPYAAEYAEVWAAPEDDLAWRASPKATIDHWRDEGMTIFGKGTFGGPEEAIARIETLQEQTGGFGRFLILIHDLADYQATLRNFELVASEVIPHFRSYRNQNRVGTLDFAKNNVGMLAGNAVAAVEQATK